MNDMNLHLPFSLGLSLLIIGGSTERTYPYKQTYLNLLSLSVKKSRNP
jgi:hypothetical protein